MSGIRAAIIILSFLTAPMALAEEEVAANPMPEVSATVRALMSALLDHFGHEIDGLTAELPEILKYHPPEMLPNGDIIIRRRENPQLPPQSAPEPSEIEL